METIEQRINREMDEYTQQHPTNDEITLKLRERVIPLMVSLCKEQQKLDIQRACEWLDEYFDRCFGVSALEFCESAKIEITKAMKGE